MIRGGLQDAYAYFAKALSLATCSGPGFTEVLVNLKKRIYPHLPHNSLISLNSILAIHLLARYFISTKLLMLM